MNIKFDKNNYLITYGFLKLSLIGYGCYTIDNNCSSFDNNCSSFNFGEIIHILHAALIIINNASFYSCICIVTEFFLGIISCCNWTNMNHIQKAYSIFSIIPTLSIWILISCIYLFFIFERYKVYQKINKKVIIKSMDLNKNYDCSICLSKIDNKGFYTCSNKHYFHQDCLQKWINLNKTCPYCRECC